MSNSFNRFKLLLGALSLTSAGFFTNVALMAQMSPNMGEETSESSEMMEMMETEAKQQTIVDIASSSDLFKTLVAALKAADLVEILAGEGPFTVFAPTDEAFAALPEGTLENLLKPENKEKLGKILTYHVVAGGLMSTDLTSGEVETVEGNSVKVVIGEDKSVKVNDANVVKADIAADNGVIHVIDRVILPPDMLTATGEETSESSEMMETEAKQQTIVDIASSAESFKTLVTALKAADLVEILAGKGPFTVFAPTDEAFAALPEGTLEDLLKPESKKKLAKILTYHVVTGDLMSTDLTSGEVKTVQGSSVNLVIGEDESVKVNDANVVTADIEASNGVIHVIDQVILPPDM